jgi:2-hydroxychromene-2-carboxylate isomerase
VAVTELAERTRARDVRLVLMPVIHRGMANDPAVELKRRYAIGDARRRGARSGLVLSRTEPLDPERLAFLSDWVCAGRQGAGLTRFCVEALRRLWFGGEEQVGREELAALWRELFDADPPLDSGSQGVRRNERHMRRRGPYDTPAAWVHGQWFFAHDRLAQIEDRLDDLGWTVTR